MKFLKIFKRGYKSDGCTMFPDILFGINMTPACKNHDFRRGNKVVSVSEADSLFRHELKDLGVNFFVRWVMYIAVVLARPFYE